MRDHLKLFRAFFALILAGPPEDCLREALRAVMIRRDEWRSH